MERCMCPSLRCINGGGEWGRVVWKDICVQLLYVLNRGEDGGRVVWKDVCV